MRRRRCSRSKSARLPARRITRLIPPRSRLQPFDGPAALGVPAVGDAVVEAALAALPELDPGGLEAVAAPEVGGRDLAAGEPLSGGGEGLLQRLAAGHRRALPRGPGAELRGRRAGRGGGRGLLARGLLAPRLDPT